jgi:DNA-binding response OmpR family regulator
VRWILQVDYQQDIQEGQGTVALTKPDAVMIDAALVDKEGSFSQLRNTLTERRIPMLILSATNGHNAPRNSADSRCSGLSAQK